MIILLVICQWRRIVSFITFLIEIENFKEEVLFFIDLGEPPSRRPTEYMIMR